MANEQAFTVGEVRATYVQLTRDLLENQRKYAQRKRDIMDKYGDEAHFRGDVILDDLSSGAKTLSAMISALTSVVLAETMYVRNYR